MASKICLFCGKEYEYILGGKTKRRLRSFCSKECSAKKASIDKTKKIMSIKYLPVEIEYKHCLHCGALFVDRKGGRKLHCNRKCTSKSGNNKRSETLKQLAKEINCSECGDKFVPHRANQMYCSKGCRIKSNNRQCKKDKFIPHMRKCKGCGEQYYATRRSHLYCSITCGAKKRYKRVRIEHKEHRKCEFCGDTYLSTNPTSKYCSVRCKDKVSMMRVSVKIRDISNDSPLIDFFKAEVKNKEEIMESCVECGKLFKKSNYGKKYCSSKCNVKNYSKRNFVPRVFTCLHCGKTVTTNKSDNRVKFCSTECSCKHFNSSKIRVRKKMTVEQKTKECVHCGKKFVQKVGTQKFCEASCRLAHNNGITETYKEVLLLRPCIECGKAFVPTRVSHVFCKTQCSTKRIRRRNREREQLALKICPTCGDTFRPTQEGQMYCTNDCGNTLRRVGEDKLTKTKKVCPICKGDFIDTTGNKKYCSFQCVKRSLKKK